MVHTSLSSKRHKGISLVPALFVFILLLISNASRATISSVPVYDSTQAGIEEVIPDTSIYDINDPRNPDCPCHNAQKLADDEFRNSQVQRGNSNPVDRGRGNVNENDNTTNTDRSGNSDNANVNVNTNKVPVTTGSAGSQRHYTKFEKFERKMKRWSKKVHRKMKSKNKGTKGGKFRVADCFHLW